MIKTLPTLKLLTLVFTTLLLSPAAWSVPMDEVQIDNGTPLIVTPMVDISSASNQTGDDISFQLVQDCKIDGIVLIKKGATVNGKVEQAVHSKMFGQQGDLQVSFSVVQAIDGSILPVRATVMEEGNLKDPSIIGKVASILPYGIGMLRNGRDAILKAGTPLTIFVDATFKFRLNKGKTPVLIAPKTK